MLNPGDIIVIVVRERNPKTHQMELVVSHGVEPDSGKNIVMSCGSPASVGAVYDSDIGEYVLRAESHSTRSR